MITSHRIDHVLLVTRQNQLQGIVVEQYASTREGDADAEHEEIRVVDVFGED